MTVNRTEHNPMRAFPIPVIPALDLMGGVVVRAVGGQRDRYAPLRSPLVRGSEPLDVARALAAKVGHMQLYLADLDAVGGGEPAWDVYLSLLAPAFDLWLDAGLSSAERAVAIGELGRGPAPFSRPVRASELKSATAKKVPVPFRVIAALESLPDLQMLAAILAAVGPDRLVFGLDLREGRPISRVPALQKPPLDLVDAAVALGVRQLIVLDVAAVGKKEGPPVVELCRQIHDRAPHLEIIAGGGVRGISDLARLRDAGCAAALVSSWLHRCDPLTI